MPETRDPQLDDLRRRARRRLVGAIVLALAAAVLVPMLLESDPKPLGEDVSVKIPPIDDGKFVSKVGEKAKGAEAPAPKAESKAEPKAEPRADLRPEVASAPGATKDAPAPAPAEAAKDAAAANVAKTLSSAEQKVLAPPVKSGSAPAKDAAPKPAAALAKDSPPKPAAAPPEAPKPAEPALAAAPSAATAPPAASPPPAAAAAAPAATSAPPAKAADPVQGAEPAKAGTYSVQLAAFIDDKGANALAGKLKKSGYPSYVEPYTTSRGTLWRVRVGPYPSRDAAEAARTKLKGDGQNGIIAAAK
jgi:DedD protein